MPRRSDYQGGAFDSSGAQAARGRVQDFTANLRRTVSRETSLEVEKAKGEKFHPCADALENWACPRGQR